jgi:hypothetical protein
MSVRHVVGNDSPGSHWDHDRGSEGKTLPTPLICVRLASSRLAFITWPNILLRLEGDLLDLHNCPNHEAANIAGVSIPKPRQEDRTLDFPSPADGSALGWS